LQGSHSIVSLNVALGKWPQYDNLFAIPIPLYFTTRPPVFSDIKLTEGRRFANSGALGYTTGR
jgi:hypothetical protein